MDAFAATQVDGSVIETQQAVPAQCASGVIQLKDLAMKCEDPEGRRLEAQPRTIREASTTSVGMTENMLTSTTVRRTGVRPIQVEPGMQA